MSTPAGNRILPPRAARDRGFALVITLIMVALAAVMVVALLVNASLERTTATSYANRLNAELAVQNGLEAAKKALTGSPSGGTSITADDAFLVLRADGTQTNSAGNKDAYYFLAKAQPGAANTVDCYPLFAGGTPSTVSIDLTKTPVFQPPTPPAAPFAPNPARETFGANTRVYPTLLTHQQAPYTQWQEVRDPADTAPAPAHNLPYQRYTFWVEDLGGMLDASAVGNQLNGGAHQRANGTNPNEIALFTIFDPTLATDSGATLAKNLTDNRSLLFTSPTLKQVAPPPAGQTDRTQEYLATRLGIDTGGERNLIPYGFAFTDAGAPKTNLNSVIGDASKSDEDKVKALAEVINKNLPLFAAKRKGGLAASEDYVKTLAANIIGYATGEPVVGTGYRGIGLHPFVVQFFERFKWEKKANEPGHYYLKNGTWWANVRVIAYVQLWNMADRAINAGTFTFTDINRYYAYLGGDSEAHPFQDVFATGSITFDASNELKANEFRVFKVYEHLYEFDSDLTLEPKPDNAQTRVRLEGETLSGPAPENCGYVTTWNGKVVERAGAGSFDGGRMDGSDRFPSLNYKGVERTIGALEPPTPAAKPKWPGSLPGLRYESPPPPFGESIYNLGDPRSAYYIQDDQADVSYVAQSAWWGRIYQSGLITQANPWKAAETAVASWPDGGHSTTKGKLPPSATTDPMTLGPAPPEYTQAPSHIAGTGKYVSITELSHIYDPIQWKPAGFPPTSRADFEKKWQDAWKSNMTTDGNYGCASTLRIGSPEFKDFDSSDSRATRLLDLFGVADRREVRGAINLNTASRDALRALAAGIEFKQDAAIAPASVFGPVNNPASPTQADKFADAVVANRPFLSPAQLADIVTIPGDATSKFFGNAAQWTSAGPTEWNDAAREEYFSRIFNLTAVRSRNFRVFVTGQTLDKKGNVLSTASREFQVYLQPTRDAAGVITHQNVNITYERPL